MADLIVRVPFNLSQPEMVMAVLNAFDAEWRVRVKRIYCPGCHTRMSPRHDIVAPSENPVRCVCPHCGHHFTTPWPAQGGPTSG